MSVISPKLNARIRVKLEVGEDDTVPSLIGVFPGADWFERETYDLYGVVFTGHPDMRRILTDYGFEGHPLRKDFPPTGFVEALVEPVDRSVGEDAPDLRLSGPMGDGSTSLFRHSGEGIALTKTCLRHRDVVDVRVGRGTGLVVVVVREGPRVILAGGDRGSDLGPRVVLRADLADQGGGPACRHIRDGDGEVVHAAVARHEVPRARLGCPGRHGEGLSDRRRSLGGQGGAELGGVEPRAIVGGRGRRGRRVRGSRR